GCALKKQLKAFLYARIGQQRERIDLRADEGRGKRQHDENDDDLRHEGQRHFLYLRQCLKSAMPLPASIAASTAGPLAMSTVQIAELTSSSASASFTASGPS